MQGCLMVWVLLSTGNGRVSGSKLQAGKPVGVDNRQIWEQVLVWVSCCNSRNSRQAVGGACCIIAPAMDRCCFLPVCKAEQA